MTSSLDQFDLFKQEVLQDRNLQEQLRNTVDKDSFLDLIITIGIERGYKFSTSDVEAAMAAANRTWLERWIG